MTSRREFLQTGVTVSTLPLASQAMSAVGAQSSPKVPLYAVIYDQRFEQSVAFARRSEALGIATRAIDGDMTSLWYHDIYHRWHQHPAAIAGLTGHGAMFCFEQLGRDRGLRMVFRAEHRPETGGALLHTLSGPAPMLTDAFGIESQAAAFGGCMADIVSNCPRERVETTTTSIQSHGRLDLGGDESALYSWVLAPIVRAATRPTS